MFFIIAGQVNRKIGARMTSGICCIISGIAYILACNAPSIVIYTVCMCFVYGGIMSAGYVAGGTLVASWFPKKKGVVMGYTTMGHNFASAFYVQLVAILIAPTVAGTTNIGENFSTGIVPIGIAAIVLGILGMIFIRNEPWERGINPDNVSDEIYQKEYDLSLIHIYHLLDAGIHLPALPRQALGGVWLSGHHNSHPGACTLHLSLIHI